MKFKVFVDGQHGTTGLKIHELLEKRDEIELLEIDEKDKKNIEKRKELLNSADLVFLCLPDDAAIESVSLIENENVKVIDASTAHRTNPSWVYGIPELTSKQRDKIKNSKRVCVPGCHASGLIISMKPLFRNKILGKNHKLIPEMKYILKTNKAPIFTPSVGNFKQGMLVMSYIEKKSMKKATNREELIKVYKDYYADELFIKIVENNDEYLENGFLNPMRCNNTNSIEVSIYENNTDLVIISRLDNLGKGASGAAIQCMNIMLGLEERKGLEKKL